jgi:hypothetical protein
MYWQTRSLLTTLKLCKRACNRGYRNVLDINFLVNILHSIVALISSSLGYTLYRVGIHHHYYYYYHYRYHYSNF